MPEEFKAEKLKKLKRVKKVKKVKKVKNLLKYHIFHVYIYIYIYIYIHVNANLHLQSELLSDSFFYAQPLEVLGQPADGLEGANRCRRSPTLAPCQNKPHLEVAS